MWVTSFQSQHEDKGRNVGESGAVENNNKVFLVIIEHESDKCATLSGFWHLKKGQTNSRLVHRQPNDLKIYTFSPVTTCPTFDHHRSLRFAFKPCGPKPNFSLLSNFYFNRVFSLTWPASMQTYWNKRKHFRKKRVQLPMDRFGTPTWPPFHCFGTPIWPSWRHVKTLHITK